MGNERFLDESPKRPPIGLRPRNIAISARLQEIEQAMQRYMDAHVLIPQEWFEEYNELRNKLISIEKR